MTTGSRRAHVGASRRADCPTLCPLQPAPAAAAAPPTPEQLQQQAARAKANEATAQWRIYTDVGRDLVAQASLVFLWGWRAPTPGALRAAPPIRERCRGCWEWHWQLPTPK